MTTKAAVIHDSLKEFECGKYLQCLKTLEDLHFPTFNLLEWVRDNNVAICSIVSKQYTETTSQIAKKVMNSTQDTLGNILMKIRNFNSTEYNLGLVTECAILYNLILIHFKNKTEENSTRTLFGEDLNSHVENTIKRILATNTCSSFRIFDNDTGTDINKSLLCCLKPLLHLWSCVATTSEKQQLGPLVKKLLAENSKEMGEWDIQFALPAVPGLTNKNRLCGTLGNNMTAMFKVLDIALRTHKFNSQVAEQIEHIGWIPHIHYIQAYCLYRECEYQKAIDVLNKLEQNFMSDILESFVLNLKGCCLFKLGNCWSGIQNFQSALKKNFSFLLPLYNVMMVYKHQQKEEAELDSLRYLVKALKREGNESKQFVKFRLNRFEISKTSYPLLTLPYALYLQSSRSLQLGHFSQAAENFLDLLTILMETPILQPSDSFMNSIPIPGVAEIHLEAAFCMLSAERYPECIAICSWLLSCISDSLPASFSESLEESSCFDKNGHSDQEEDFLLSDSEISKKRPRSKISSKNYFADHSKHCISETSSMNDVLVSALLYKADAYFHLQETENIFSCLQRATNIIKNESANLIPDSPELEPLSKRQKINLGSQPTSDPYPVELNTKRKHQNSLISSVYNNTGVLLQCQKKIREALHCFRMGLQINPHDPSLNFNCALTLIQLKETEQAAFFWAKHRAFDFSMDTVRLKHKLSEKQKELELLQNANQKDLPDVTKITDTPEPCTLLRFDICILRTLLQSK